MKENSFVDPNDPLVMRLAALDIPVPSTLIPRVLAAHHLDRRGAHRRSRKLLVSLATLIALIAANLGASYVSPKYAQVLADAPAIGVLTGPVLQQAGLGTTGAQPLDVRATASGYTVRLFGAYADGIRTTLFIQILGPDGREAPDGTAPFSLSSTSLTDQFGHTYHMMNGFGMPVIHFEPLTGLAATVGARLTLHIDSLGVPPPPATSPPRPTAVPGANPVVKPTAGSTIIHGPWDLQFTQTSSGGRDLALPPAVRLGDTDYTFTVVRLTSSLLEVRWTITGGAVARQDRLTARARERIHADRVPGNLGRRQFANFQEMATSKLFDPSGKEIEPVYGFGQGVMQNGKTVAFTMDAWFPISAQGRYQFRVSDLAGPQDVRTVDVP